MGLVSYHNTTDSVGAEFRRYAVKAATQEKQLLELFAISPERSYTPSEAVSATWLNAPLTSIRRAISNLTAAGELEKTAEQRPGPYGRPEYCWRAAEKYRYRQHSLFGVNQ